ncbi:Bromodomain and PHD finger-containing protein 3 [Quillaja saponaria]|uniref:Bromodomain and PHD finger-containing protein 3 n=1 Tax=Quillaja saponaria TaxID=32244 RepID=A0AAD7LWG2_QUISA|nr:Bromodomain and PHD finger-containing protein 3 [Quillaja saponaria]
MKLFNDLRTNPDKVVHDFYEKQLHENGMKLEGRGKGSIGGTSFPDVPEMERRHTYKKPREYEFLKEFSGAKNSLSFLHKLGEGDCGYKESLLRFVKHLGPTAVMVAYKKLANMEKRQSKIAGSQAVENLQTMSDSLPSKQLTIHGDATAGSADVYAIDSTFTNASAATDNAQMIQMESHMLSLPYKQLTIHGDAPAGSANVCTINSTTVNAGDAANNVPMIQIESHMHSLPDMQLSIRGDAPTGSGNVHTINSTMASTCDSANNPPMIHREYEMLSLPHNQLDIHIDAPAGSENLHTIKSTTAKACHSTINAPMIQRESQMLSLPYNQLAIHGDAPASSGNVHTINSATMNTHATANNSPMIQREAEAYMLPSHYKHLKINDDASAGSGNAHTINSVTTNVPSAVDKGKGVCVDEELDDIADYFGGKIVPSYEEMGSFSGGLTRKQVEYFKGTEETTKASNYLSIWDYDVVWRDPTHRGNVQVQQHSAYQNPQLQLDPYNPIATKTNHWDTNASTNYLNPTISNYMTVDVVPKQGKLTSKVWPTQVISGPEPEGFAIQWIEEIGPCGNGNSSLLNYGKYPAQASDQALEWSQIMASVSPAINDYTNLQLQLSQNNPPVGLLPQQETPQWNQITPFVSPARDDHTNFQLQLSQNNPLAALPQQQESQKWNQITQSVSPAMNDYTNLQLQLSQNNPLGRLPHLQESQLEASASRMTLASALEYLGRGNSQAQEAGTSAQCLWEQPNLVLRL